MALTRARGRFRLAGVRRPGRGGDPRRALSTRATAEMVAGDVVEMRKAIATE